MAVTKLSLYNDAAQLLGQGLLSTDTDDEELRYDLDQLYDNGGVDVVLEYVKPRYAVAADQITAITPTAETTYSGQIPLPSDFVALSVDEEGYPEVYRDGKYESRVERFVREANYLLCDEASVYIRYVKAHTAGFLTTMTPAFARAVAAYFAKELAWKYDPDRAESIAEDYEDKATKAGKIRDDSDSTKRGFAPDTLTTTWLAIYNDALSLAKVDPIVSTTDDSLRRHRLDIALDNNLVASVLEDTGWRFGRSSDEVTYNAAIEPAWGYPYVFDLPAGMHRLHGIYVDEYMRYPLRDYVQEGSQIFCSLQKIYIEYVDNAFLTTPDDWPSYFRRYIAAQMASDANIPGKDDNSIEDKLKTRRREAISTDAISNPPKRFSEGSWSRSRGNYRGSQRNRP